MARRPDADPNKFPLTLHATGQWCKSIKGKMVYFGRDKEKALQDYLTRKDELYGVVPVAAKQAAKRLLQELTVASLANVYLHEMGDRVKDEDVSSQRWLTSQSVLAGFVASIGEKTLVVQLEKEHFKAYRRKLRTEGKAANTINTYRAIIRTMFRWAVGDGLLPRRPKSLAALKPVKEGDRTGTGTERIFTPQEIESLLKAARPALRAMILLGLNCGFGPTDCARLKWANLDLVNQRVSLPRSKTGVGRDCRLWPDTIAAIQALPVRGANVFMTVHGRLYHRQTSSGTVITISFKRCARRANVNLPKGAGFYTLRRTGATVLAGTGDVFAVQAFLGHKCVEEAATYVKTIQLRRQTDAGVMRMVDWLQQRAEPATETVPHADSPALRAVS